MGRAGAMAGHAATGSYQDHQGGRREPWSLPRPWPGRRQQWAQGLDLLWSIRQRTLEPNIIVRSAAARAVGHWRTALRVLGNTLDAVACGVALSLQRWGRALQFLEDMGQGQPCRSDARLA